VPIVFRLSHMDTPNLELCDKKSCILWKTSWYFPLLISFIPGPQEKCHVPTKSSTPSFPIQDAYDTSFGQNPILQSLTNYIWKYINFVNQMNIYVNIFHDDFNNIDLVLWIMILCSVHLVKVYKVWFSLKLICILIREGASISFLCNRVGLINEFFAS
jgi:hypothetical protein